MQSHSENFGAVCHLHAPVWTARSFARWPAAGLGRASGGLDPEGGQRRSARWARKDASSKNPKVRIPPQGAP